MGGKEGIDQGRRGKNKKQKWRGRGDKGREGKKLAHVSYPVLQGSLC